MSTRLIAVDLDGTLLGTDMRVSEANLAAARRLRARGVLTVPCTGRALSELPPCLLDEALFPYLILSSGALIHDRTCERRYTAAMDTALCERALMQAAAWPSVCILHADGRSFVDAATHDARYYTDVIRMSAGMADMIYTTATPHPALGALCRSAGSLEMVSIFFPDRTTRDACADRLRSLGIRPSCSADTNLEFVAAGTDKGTALGRLCAALGIDPADTLAVGDSGNDLPLLRTAGRALAVRDACPALQAVADEVICSNDEHILVYLDTYI